VRKWVIPAAVGGLGALWWLVQGSSSPEAALPVLQPGQQEFVAIIKAEALRQGVPVELALATAEVESGFRDVQNGSSYGPMQVHISGLLPGESATDLKNPTFSIARGVSILKQRLKLAKGDTLLARIMYLCGPGYQKSCSEAAIARLRTRWGPVASKYGVAATYTV